LTASEAASGAGIAAYRLVEDTGERRMRNLIFALAALIGVVVVAASAARTF
jgi:hypothetical protein